MTNKGLSKIGLRVLDRTTDIYPQFGPKIFQRAFVGFFGNTHIAGRILRKYRREWTAARALLERSSIKKVLVIVDVCIGDAVLVAETLSVLRTALPGVELHYVCNRTGGELVDGIDSVCVHKIVQGARGFPTADDLERLRALAERESFPLVLNFGPFIGKRALGSGCRMIQLYVPFAAYTLQAWNANGVRHISYLVRTFLDEFLGVPSDRTPRLNTNAVYLSDGALDESTAFLETRGLDRSRGIVFFNPDATSKYGQIPFDIQVKLLREMAERKQISAILIGRAYSSVDIERSLVASLPEPLRKKVFIVPHLPIETYTALIDASDMFISGDTGPLHIAACRKRGMDGRDLRNGTAVVAIYGATDSRMYGYDSVQPFHAPANQDAPSRSFSAPAPCRNISCINKFGKSCAHVRCFDNLPIEDIAGYIAEYFQRLSEPASIVSSKPVTITLTTSEREYAF